MAGTELKILQINKYYYLKSGSERYLFNVSSMLESHGHEIIPFAMKHEKNMNTKYSKYFVDNIDYNKVVTEKINKKIVAGFKTIYSLEAKNKLLKLLEKENPDIAHIHKISNTLTPSILYALKKKAIPTVMTLHDYRIICPNYCLYDPNIPGVCEACKSHGYINALTKKCQKSSYLAGLNIALESYLYHIMATYVNTIDFFISPSKFVMNKVVEFGIPKERVVFIPHFVRIDEYTPNYVDSDYILYFGRVEKHKGVKTLIDAIKKINDIKLYIVGEGAYKEELENYLKIKGIKNVILFGFVAEDKLTNIIKDCLFTIVPSEWYEPFGFTVLESFSSGKPVIGANIGGISELIENRRNGILFRSGDSNELENKIRYLLNNKDLVLKMGKNARGTVERKYNARLHYERLMKTYTKLLN
jgi:glycosyltransferase involved in cell wall biosynthesis